MPFFQAKLRDEYRGKGTQLDVVLRNFRALARGIEKLAPAVGRADSPENAEYPWERAGEVYAPCAYDFPALGLLRAPGGRSFLKLLHRALDELA